jgi:methionyl aminopeptidase
MSRHSVELKTNDQIILMRDAGLATAAALREVRKAIRPGISTLELDAIAEATIIAKGGHSNFKLVAGYRHTICASINDEVVHGIPSADRILKAGDIVSIDCGAEIGEWNGDSAITVIVPNEDGSQVDSDLVRARQTLSDVTEQSLWVGIAALAKAEYLNEVGMAIEEYLFPGQVWNPRGVRRPRHWSVNARRSCGLQLCRSRKRFQGSAWPLRGNRANGCRRKSPNQDPQGWLDCFNQRRI